MSTIPLSLNFSEENLQRIELPVTLNFPAPQGKRTFILREADGDIACRYKNFLTDRVTLVDGKPSKISKAADIGPLLISWCLQETLEQPDGSFKLIGYPKLDDIRKWKPSVLNELQETIESISELGHNDDTLESLIKEKDKLNEKIEEMEKEKDAAKNE